MMIKMIFGDGAKTVGNGLGVELGRIGDMLVVRVEDGSITRARSSVFVSRERGRERERERERES